MFGRCVLSFRRRLKYSSATLVKCLLKILAMSLSFVYVLLLYVIDTMVLRVRRFVTKFFKQFRQHFRVVFVGFDRF